MKDRVNVSHPVHLPRLPNYLRTDSGATIGVAVEVKVDGSAYLVARQLRRYLRCPDVHAVLLITTRAAHVRLANPPRCEVILLRTWP